MRVTPKDLLTLMILWLFSAVVAFAGMYFLREKLLADYGYVTSKVAHMSVKDLNLPPPPAVDAEIDNEKFFTPMAPAIALPGGTPPATPPFCTQLQQQLQDQNAVNDSADAAATRSEMVTEKCQ